MDLKLERKENVMDLKEGNKVKKYSSIELQAECKAAYDEGLITGEINGYQKGWFEAVEMIIDNLKKKFDTKDVKSYLRES